MISVSRGSFLSSSQLSPHNAASAHLSSIGESPHHILFIFPLRALDTLIRKQFTWCSACRRSEQQETWTPVEAAAARIIWIFNARCEWWLRPIHSPLIWSTEDGARRQQQGRAGGINRHHLPPPRRRPGHVQKTKSQPPAHETRNDTSGSLRGNAIL